MGFRVRACGRGFRFGSFRDQRALEGLAGRFFGFIVLCVGLHVEFYRFVGRFLEFTSFCFKSGCSKNVSGRKVHTRLSV